MELKTLKFKRGNIIALEGSIGTCAYLIKSGKVEIASTENGKRVVQSLLGEDQVFDEMQLIVDEPVPHTATAVEDTELKVITRKVFSAFFLKGDYTILSVLSALLERLRKTDKKVPIVNDIQEKIPTDNHEETSTDVEDGILSGTSGSDMNNISRDMQEDISDDVPVNDINAMVKDMPWSEEGYTGEKIVDKRYLLLYGLNDISKDALKWREIEIRKFPFKVGRVEKEALGDEVRAKIGIQDFVFSENNLRIYEEGPHYYLSVNHFEIDKIGGVFTLVDKGSRLGVIVNDVTIKGSCILKQENLIIIGSSYSPFLFKLDIKGEIVNEQMVGKEKEAAVDDKAKSFQSVDKDSGFDLTGG